MCKGVNVCVAGSLGMSTGVNVPLQLAWRVDRCGWGDCKFPTVENSMEIPQKAKNRTTI